MKYLIFILVTLLIQGCATKYQETTDWEFKGGYFEEKLGDGLFRVTGKTDVGSFVNYSEARKIFTRRAAELCSNKGYAILSKKEHYLRDEPMGSTALPVNDTFIPIEGSSMTVTIVEGEILCKNSSLSIEHSKQLLANGV